MSYVPVHLTPYVRPANYAGKEWFGWYPVAGITRDSGTIERSNFRVIEKALSAIADPGYLPAGADPSEEQQAVQVTRCNHFLCGWVDTIYIHESHEEALRLADEFAGAIADYPLLDEMDHGMLECEKAADCWEGFSLRDRIEACRRFQVSIFAARRADEIPQDPTGELIGYLAG